MAFFFLYISFLFWKKCAISFQIVKCWWARFEQGVTVKNNWWSVKNNEQTTVFHHVVHIRLARVVILASFCSHIYSSSGVVICPLHACPAQQGSPGRTNPFWRVWSSPTIPFPPPLPIPTLSASSCPTTSLPICPASLPYDLDADKTRGPAVPSAWCQHFPLIQSQSCCVTDGIGDQKQLPCLKKE